MLYCLSHCLIDCKQLVYLKQLWRMFTCNPDFDTWYEVETYTRDKMTSLSARHILDLYCVRLSNAAHFYENYAKIYAKHLEKELNHWMERVIKILGPFFQKKVRFFHEKVPLLANVERCPKLREYALISQLLKVSSEYHL